MQHREHLSESGLCSCSCILRFLPGAVPLWKLPSLTWQQKWQACPQKDGEKGALLITYHCVRLLKEAVVDGQVSLADATALWEDALDGNIAARKGRA